MDAVAKRVLLYGAAAMLAASAALAIAAVLTGGLDPLLRRVQTSALVLGAGSLVVLALAEVRARGAARQLGAAGLVVVLVAIALNLVAVWIDAPADSLWGRLTATVTFAALALTAVGLMALARMEGEWQERVRAATSASVAVLLVLLWWRLWASPQGEWFAKGLHVVAIVTALGAASVFILHIAAHLGGKENRK